MKTLNQDHKIILSCNKQGVLEKVYLDTASLLDSIQLPVGLHNIVSPISIQQMGSFWLSIQEESMEENRILTLNYKGQQLNYIFSGFLLKDTILLCGNAEMNSTEKVFEEIMLINNEQANKIRLSEKRLGIIQNQMKMKEINKSFLNDFSSLNNELINNKRELIRKNQKIELLNQELNAVNENMKMFTHSVSHDLREPVRMIKSFLTLLDKKYGENLDEKGKTYMYLASDGASRLNKMLDGLLEYHQSSNTNTAETVDLNEVFFEVTQILKEQFETKNAQVSSGKLPIIKGSFAGLRQIFQNLISNAIKFVPEGKTPIVSIKAVESVSNYTLMVKDNGIGIPEKQLQEVFSLFKRLNSSQKYEGSGMGLAIVKKSIERMGGEIWIQSAEGEGSTFHFTLPKNDIKLK